MTLPTANRRAILRGAVAAALAAGPARLFAQIDRQALLVRAYEEEIFGLEAWTMYLESERVELPPYLKDKLQRHGNREAEAALQRLAAPLCRTSTRTDLDWRVGLVSTNAVNAHAFPGGVIMVTTGLIELCENETELASVIGHEVGHIEHRHFMQRIRAEEVLQRYGIDLAVDQASLAAAVRSNRYRLYAEAVIYRSFARLFEYEADAFSIRALSATGYNPHLAHTLFAKLVASWPDDTDLSTCLVSTHPLFRDRIPRMQGLARGYANRGRTAASDDFNLLAGSV